MSFSENTFSGAQRAHIFFHIVDPKYVPTAAPEQRGQGNGWRQSIAHFRGSNEFAEKSLTGASHRQWAFLHTKTFQVPEELEIMRERFSETNSRIKRNGHGINM